MDNGIINLASFRGHLVDACTCDGDCYTITLTVAQKEASMSFFKNKHREKGIWYHTRHFTENFTIEEIEESVWEIWHFYGKSIYPLYIPDEEIDSYLETVVGIPRDSRWEKS